MTRDQAKDIAKGRIAEYLRSKGIDPKRKFNCLNPEHNDTNPSMSLYAQANNVHCFACGASYDIFSLVALDNPGLTENEVFNKTYEFCGLTIDGAQEKPKLTPDKQAIIAPPEESKAPDPDFTDFFLEAKSHIKETDYPQRRGLSEEVIERFKLGYIDNWKHPKAPQTAPESPRLIIPISPSNYFARDTRENLTEEQKQYSKLPGGNKKHLFNQKALITSKRPVFIVEGEIDALSIIEAGGEAVALGGLAGATILYKNLMQQRPAQPLLLALDNDEPGIKATERLIEQLKTLKPPITYYKTDVEALYLGHKDANEALLADRQAFIAELRKAEKKEEQEQEELKQQYLTKTARYYIPAFVSSIRESANIPFIPTGFKELDRTLDGGLYEGLYFLGAISSLGKTTFITQITDYIAKSGKDILFFSLEMSRSELMARSISRHTLEAVLKNDLSTKLAKTLRGITNGTEYSRYSQAEKDHIKASIEAYSAYADHIFIEEGMGDIGVKEVREAVEEHYRVTGNRPVVVIDYLQILAPYEPKANDKQNTDKAVLELKRISRDFKIPVIAVSSFNRMSYNSPVDMSAFKESGAIEYSSDVLMGLQLKGVNVEGFNVNIEKEKDPREVELVILKNRNGKTSSGISFKYHKLFYCFEER